MTSHFKRNSSGRRGGSRTFFPSSSPTIITRGPLRRSGNGEGAPHRHHLQQEPCEVLQGPTSGLWCWGPIHETYTLESGRTRSRVH